jgi:hypothetical protein
MRGLYEMRASVASQLEDAKGQTQTRLQMGNDLRRDSGTIIALESGVLERAHAKERLRVDSSLISTFANGEKACHGARSYSSTRVGTTLCRTVSAGMAAEGFRPLHTTDTAETERGGFHPQPACFDLQSMTRPRANQPQGPKQRVNVSCFFS